MSYICVAYHPFLHNWICRVDVFRLSLSEHAFHFNYRCVTFQILPPHTTSPQKLYGAWRTWRRPPTSSLLLDWSCKRTRRRRRHYISMLLSLWSASVLKMKMKKLLFPCKLYVLHCLYIIDELVCFWQYYEVHELK